MTGRTGKKQLYKYMAIYVAIPSEMSHTDTFFVILRYLHPSTEHTSLFKMMCFFLNQIGSPVLL